MEKIRQKNEQTLKLLTKRQSVSRTIIETSTERFASINARLELSDCDWLPEPAAAEKSTQYSSLKKEWAPCWKREVLLATPVERTTWQLELVDLCKVYIYSSKF